MSTQDKPAAAPTQAQHAELLDQARAKGYDQAKQELAGEITKARAEGALAERARIKAITTCDAAKDRPTFAAHLAFDDDASVEKAQAMLAKAGKEASAANPLAAAMAGVPNPKVGADAGEPQKQRPVIDASSIFAARAKAMQDAKPR